MDVEKREITMQNMPAGYALERKGNEVFDFGFLTSACETCKWRYQVGGQM